MPKSLGRSPARWALARFVRPVLKGQLMWQALKGRDERMIRESDRFDDSIQELFRRFDKEKSLTYSISADVFPKWQWKGPYDNFTVRCVGVQQLMNWHIDNSCILQCDASCLPASCALHCAHKYTQLHSTVSPIPSCDLLLCIMCNAMHLLCF